MKYHSKQVAHCLSIGLALGLLAAPSLAQGIDFSRPVFLGDSLTAGYQSGSLHEDYQPQGYANLIAHQTRAPLVLPLIAAPGIPNMLVLVDPGPPPVIAPLPGTSTGRVDPMLQATNLAVPGHNVQDALTKRPEMPIDDATDLVLGLPGLLGGVSKSQVEWAEALSPSVVFIWLGSNDVLAAALEADLSKITPTGQFAVSMAEVFDRASAIGAPIVVGNVPDVATVPYLTSAEELAAQFPAVPQATIFALLGIGEGDFVIPGAFGEIAAILGQQKAGPLGPALVLDAGEVMTMQRVIDVYNAVIQMEAKSHDAIPVDLNRLLDRLDSQGAVIGGVHLTTDFLGGIFSLDGVHPTNTGHAIVANYFIRAINDSTHAGIALVDVESVMATDPLVFNKPGMAPASACSPDPESARQLLETIGG